MTTYRDSVRRKLLLSGFVGMLSWSQPSQSQSGEASFPLFSHYSRINEYVERQLPSWECDPRTYWGGRWHATLPTTSEVTTDYEICGMKQIPVNGKLRKVQATDSLTERERRKAYNQIILSISRRVTAWLPQGVESRLTVSQLIALWDIEWNTSSGVRGYSRLRAALERNDLRAAAEEVLALRAHGGIIEPGLIKRSAWRASQFDPATWEMWAGLTYSTLPKKPTEYANYRKFIAWNITRKLKRK